LHLDEDVLSAGDAWLREAGEPARLRLAPQSMVLAVEAAPSG
jgi:hypothetical protein